MEALKTSIESILSLLLFRMLATTVQSLCVCLANESFVSKSTLIFLPEPAVQAFHLPLVADSGQQSTFVGLCLMSEGLLHSAMKITLFMYH